MNKQNASKRKYSRRDFLKLAGGAAFIVAGSSIMPQFLRKTLLPTSIAHADETNPDLYFAGTDGWIYLPPSPEIVSETFGKVHPDSLAPAPFNTYIFGFRNLTGLTPDQRHNQKNHAQHNAPLFWVDEYDPAVGQSFYLKLTNLGLAQRPDLTDSHTLHWHGFRNVIPFFDGEPTGSVSVPVGREFTYVYVARDPGTYMYHCHVEDVEHVHMGMTGLVFVRPLQNKNTALLDLGTLRSAPNNIPFSGFAYNDGDGSSGYDREFAMFLSEVWAAAHWCDAHIQLPDWTDYHVDFALLNGRVYPDTLAPNGPIDDAASTTSIIYQTNSDGDLIADAEHPELQYQPLSALVNCNEGENVLLRFANLGFREASMTLEGIKMRVVGRDATPMHGRDGSHTSYETETLLIGAGESFDVIFTAPAYQGPGTYDTYMLYNRRFTQDDNLAGGSFGGQATEVRVYASGVLPAQTLINT